MVVAEIVGSYSKQTSSNQYRLSYVLAVMDSIETPHHKKAVAADIVGFRFEAELFKAAQKFLGFGCHGQH